MSQAAADELQHRLVSFAVKIIELAGHFPKTPAGRHVSGQILRSGTSPAPNYGGARGVESRADFVHKFRSRITNNHSLFSSVLILLHVLTLGAFNTCCGG